MDEQSFSKVWCDSPLGRDLTEKTTANLTLAQGVTVLFENPMRRFFVQDASLVPSIEWGSFMALLSKKSFGTSGNGLDQLH